MSSPLLSPIATASITAWIDGISTIGIFPLVCKTCPKEKIYATRIVALRLTGIPAFDDHVKDYLLQHSSRVNPDVTIVTVARVAAIFRSLSRPFCTLHALRIDDDRIARYCDKIFSNVLLHGCEFRIDQITISRGVCR